MVLNGSLEGWLNNGKCTFEEEVDQHVLEILVLVLLSSVNRSHRCAMTHCCYVMVLVELRGYNDTFGNIDIHVYIQ